MKGLVKITSIMTIMLMLVSCVVHEHRVKRIPPGQAKKVYGGSARYYAPGQVKKRVYYYDYGYDSNKNYHHKKHKRK